MRTAHSLMYGGKDGQRPPRQRPPIQRPPWTESSSEQRPPGQRTL